jgi:hypothetical protein
VIHADYSRGSPELKVDGKLVNRELVTPLTMVITGFNGAAGSVNAEAMFGSRSPRRVGDSWEVDSAAMRAWIADMHETVSDRDVTGSVKLAEVKRVSDQDALVVHVDASAANLHGTPESPGLETGSFRFSLRLVTPVAPGGAPLAQSHRLLVASMMRGSDPEGHPFTIDLTRDDQVERTFNRLRKPDSAISRPAN